MIISQFRVLKLQTDNSQKIEECPLSTFVTDSSRFGNEATIVNLNLWGLIMKNFFKKSSAIVLLISIVSVSLVGCGTGADSGGMGGNSKVSSLK